jgi:hypothetical protein
MKAELYTVIDRATNHLRDANLTERQVVDQHVEQGERSAALTLIRDLRVGKTVTLADVIVRRSA